MALSSLMHITGSPKSRARELSSYLGMVLFLGILTMWFGALFFAYAVLRVNAESWPPEGNRLPVAWPAFNTLVLFASSAALWTGQRRILSGRPRLFARWLAATMVLGAAFLGLQLKVWIAVWQGGLTVQSGAYGSVFYGLTVIHAVHIVVGLIALWIIAIPAFRGENLTARYSRVRGAAMFWHFIDVVWLLMFVTVYVL